MMYQGKSRLELPELPYPRPWLKYVLVLVAAIAFAGIGWLMIGCDAGLYVPPTSDGKLVDDGGPPPCLQPCPVPYPYPKEPCVDPSACRINTCADAFEVECVQ